MKVIIFDVGQTLCKNTLNYLETCKNQATSALVSLKSVIEELSQEGKDKLFLTKLSMENFNLNSKLFEEEIVRKILEYRELKNKTEHYVQKIFYEYVYEVILEQNLFQLKKEELELIKSNNCLLHLCKSIMVKDTSVCDQYTVFDDLIPTLEYLKSKGYKLVICSNDGHPHKIRQMLEKNKLTSFFDPIIISGEVNLRKPDPKILQIIKSRFPGVKDYEYVIIGDMIDRDILCGNKSNIRTMWFTNDIFDPEQCFRKLPYIKPDLIFSHYLQLKDLIDILDKDALFISSQSPEFQNIYRKEENYKLLPSSHLLKVAYYFTTKKIGDMSQRKMITSNDKILFIPLLLDCPLDLQGPFNALIHKGSDLMVDDIIKKKNKKYTLLIDYNAKNEGKMAFIDPVKNMEFSIDRNLTNTIFDNVFTSQPFVDLFKKFNKKMRIPPWTSELNKDPISCFTKIKLWMETNKINFPLFLKPYISCQSNESHLLSIAMSDKGLTELLKDKNYKDQTLNFQTFIPHSNTIYKVYTVGEYVSLLIKKSLPSKLNFADYFFFDSQKPFPKELIENLQIVDKIDRQFMTECCIVIEKAISLTMLGIDIIIDEITGEYYLIDINYLSSYKHEKDMNPIITKHIIKCIKDQCHQ